MKRLTFYAMSMMLLAMHVLPLYSFAGNKKDKRDYYQIKIYHCKNLEQVSKVEDYLQHAYLPALHRMGLTSIGVFTPIDNDTLTDKKVIVFMPISSPEQLVTIEHKLIADQQLATDGASYLNAAYDQPAYQRIESTLLHAFPLHPKYTLPTALTTPKEERIYELRSYEGATENLYRSKVKMFNEGGEIALFKRLEFNAVFYSEVVSGAHMPNLMYMTTFNNRAQRDEHWKVFGSDPEWKRLSSLPEYLHTVSRADIMLLHPTSYSDF